MKKDFFFFWRSAHRELDLGEPLLSLDGRVHEPAPQQCRSTGGG